MNTLMEKMKIQELSWYCASCWSMTGQLLLANFRVLLWSQQCLCRTNFTPSYSIITVFPILLARLWPASMSSTLDFSKIPFYFYFWLYKKIWNALNTRRSDPTWQMKRDVVGGTLKSQRKGRGCISLKTPRSNPVVVWRDLKLTWTRYDIVRQGISKEMDWILQSTR